MDLSVIHHNLQNGMRERFAESSGKETELETDVQRNNNLFNSSKTETKSGHNPSSLFQDVKYISEESLKVENSIFSYSSFQRAMDLTIHCRSSNGETKKTIFEDADFFSKNYMYKLLPITFENVDETIIHTEHNYCHSSLSSGSDGEEDCSRTMDYSQIKEKNYKRRKTKNDRATDENTFENGDQQDVSSLPNTFPSPSKRLNEVDHKNYNSFHIKENSTSQPLDLSAPLVQENKTDLTLKLNDSSIVNSKVNEKEDGGEFDSDKENQKSNLRCIEVTITRPDEKKNYEPCDLFLNDIARLVPKLIRKDCFEIDILDRTCDLKTDIQKHRLYYIVSERTWQLFQTANERVILTNDQSLGQPVQKMDENEKPTFIIFDQISLAKCLADYCKEIGGCFEYTCVEDAKDFAVRTSDKLEEAKSGDEIKSDVAAEKKENRDEKEADEPENIVKEKLKSDLPSVEGVKNDIKEKLTQDCKERTAKRKINRREDSKPKKVIKTEEKSSVSRKKSIRTENPKKTTPQDIAPAKIFREIKTRSKSTSQPKGNIKTSQKNKEEKTTKRKTKTALKPVESPKKPREETERKTRSGKTPNVKIQKDKEAKPKDSNKKQEVRQSVRKLRPRTDPQSVIAQKVTTHKTVPKTAPKGRKR